MDINDVVVEETVVETVIDDLEGNTIEESTCTICETIDYTEQLNAINDGIYFTNAFIAIYVSFYIFNYIVNKFIIKKEA